jgi:hypothetical protein
LEQECNRAIRCSAWLGVAPRPRRTKDGALKLGGVWLMAEDSEPTATKLKLPETATRSALAVMIGSKTCGVMVWCDSVPPNR